jgi:tetratricopeptide (TPR) repeat protein
MYKNFICLLALLTLMSPVYGQTVTIPLIEKIDNSDKENTNTAAESPLMKTLSLLFSGKPKEAEQQGLIALERANKSGDSDYITSAKFCLAQVYRGEERYDESLKIYQEILATYTLQKNSDWIQAMILNNIGEIYRSRGQFDKAVGVLLEARSKADNKVSKSCAIEQNLGIAYMQLHKTQEAEQAMKRAIELSDTSLDRNGIVDSRAVLAMIYYREGRLAEAESLIYEALEKSNFLGITSSRMNELRELQAAIKTQRSPQLEKYASEMKSAITDVKSNNFSDSIPKFQNALKIAESISQNAPSMEIQATLMWMGEAQLKLAQYKEAEVTTTRAIEMYHKLSLNTPELLGALESRLKTAKDMQFLSAPKLFTDRP